MDLYDVLGISPQASQDEVKSAYREQAKQHHPDKGGDPEKFRQAQLAYDTLSDEERRAKYDRGETQDIDPVKSFLSHLYLTTISKVDIDFTDVFGIMVSDIKARIFGLHQQKKECEKAIKRLNKVKKRIKKDSNLLFSMLTEGQVNALKLQIKQMDEGIRIASEALKKVEHCEYDFDKKPVPPVPTEK